ncbi:SatD family protein [Dyadobacter sp. CY323]|uniref:SatD family protein n=1 Tax=Dyadobacter sp. CY323 TaxID=2907302 RepID=UPI001F326908|nr:SatD family protein [Dyadobacter sp. CY323]MCE6991692.1 SatD family protein [Dyadobacter sp. CY323]
MKAIKKNHAVITADMVNSTRFSREETAAWLEELIALLREHKSFNWALKPEIYRGDSFQGVLKNPAEVMRVAVLARAVMRTHDINTDLRVAIGIGKIDPLTDRPGTSDGEAFRLSGHLADNIRKQKARIGIALPIPTEPLNASLDLLETLIENWTTAQSEVIAALLNHNNITQIAERLSISQSAVSQRIAASKWWAVENFLTTFPKHLALYTKR